MNKEQFKATLQRDKQFLKSLFESDSVIKSKRILTFASDNELTTLSKYLHFISNGEIPIKKQNFDVLSKKHIQLIRKAFENKFTLQTFLQKQRKEKMLLFIKLLRSLPQLLTPLFRE